MRAHLRLATFFLATALAVPAVAGELSGRASVIDGDTLDIHGTRVRMQGIDAPESAQLCEREGERYRCGQQAANFLDGLIAGRPVRCTERDRDRYGRSVAVCFVGGIDLNREMVANGWAVAYRQYSRAYVVDEELAKAGRKGIWAGMFQAPEEYRRAKREGGHEQVRAEAKGNCAIKGNISSRGERIYHLPGSDAYARTKIDESKGEKWFCDETQARAAGWRRAGE